MAVIGYMGDSPESGIVFVVSDKTLRTVSNWSWSGKARYSTHNRAGTSALTEFVGLDPDEMQFDIQLKKSLGVSPMEDIKKIFSYEREGTAVAVVIGDHQYGKYRWSIVSHEVTVESTDGRGNITDATVTVKLQEYLNE